MNEKVQRYKKGYCGHQWKIALWCSQCSHECLSYVGPLSLLKCFWLFLTTVFRVFLNNNLVHSLEHTCSSLWPKFNYDGCWSENLVCQCFLNEHTVQMCCISRLVCLILSRQTWFNRHLCKKWWMLFREMSLFWWLM